MTPLSVVIITFNEEKNIGRCIESVLKIADDIVILDSFSTDATEKIATGYPGVRFFQHSFDGHIEQKNRAVTRALYPHILSLDADEALSPELKESIVRVKEHWEKDGYYMNRLTWYCDKWIRHCGWYPDRKLRLWDSRKGQWGGDNPHDRYIPEPGATLGCLKGDLLHYSYYTIAQHLDQIRRFAEIKSRTMHNKGKKGSEFMVLYAPPIKLFRDYFLKLGFLDGFYGFVVSANGAYCSFLTYLLLWQRTTGRTTEP
jgi:glycosyltransferase involved in cell wall biosynthesis